MITACRAPPDYRFFLDVISCTSVVGYFLDTADGAVGARMGKTLRIVRITKLLRLARLERALSKMNLNIGLLIRAVGLFTISIMCFHLFGCAWHYASSFADTNHYGQTVHGWTNSSQWDDSSRYFESVYRSIYGAVSQPTSYEMICLIGIFLIRHFHVVYNKTLQRRKQFPKRPFQNNNIN